MADKGIEIATAYVSLTVSARGIQGQIERELGGPIEAVSATASAKAAANLESGLGAVDGAAIGATIGTGIGTGIETSASAAAVATRYSFEEQLGAVDTGVLAGAIAGSDMPAAGAAVGAATASAVDAGLGAVGTGAVASFERNFAGPAISSGSEAGVQVGNAFTRALDDATAIGYRKLSRVGNVLLTTAAVGAGASALLANSASDFIETQNRANVVLGRDGAASAEKFATAALKTAGLSRQEALSTQSLFAVFGKGAGLQGAALDEFDKSLTQLGGDLASFYDTSTAQASAAIQSGLEGQVRPLRQYGVLLDDARLKQRAMTLGAYDGTGVLSQQARVLAVQAEVMAQTSDAQGDFVRTSGSLANQQRSLKAEFQNTAETIGRDLMPAALSTVHGFQAVLGLVDRMPAPLRETGVEVLALAVGASALGGVLAKLGSGYSFLSTIGDRISKARSAGTVVGSTAEAGAAAAAVAPNEALATSQTKVAQSGELVAGTEPVAAASIELEARAADSATVSTTRLAGAQDLVAGSSQRASRFTGAFASTSSKTVAGLAIATEALWAYNYAVEESAKQRSAGVKATSEDALGIQAAFDPKATDHLIKYRTELDLVSARISKLLTDGNATTPLTGIGQKLDFLGLYSGSETQEKDRVALIKGQLSALQGSLDGLNPEGLNTARHFLDDLNGELRRTGLTGTQVTAILGPTSAKLDGLEAAAEAAGHGVDDASVSLDKAASSLEEIKGKTDLARVGYDSLAAGAKAFSDEMERQSSLDNRLQGAVGVSSARASFLDQLGNLPKDIDPDKIALGGTGTVSKLKGVEAALDAVDRALGKINEDQKLNTLQWDAMQAGAKGFSDSLERSSGLNSLLSGALGISDAVTSFRQGLDHLPATVDINNIISTSFTDPLPAKDGAKSGWNWPDSQRPAADDGSATKSLQAVLALSSATREYLSTIVGQGDYAAARANADLLRTSYEKQLASVGIVGASARKYIEILGLTPKQIETAIKVSGADEARFKVESLLSLYRDQLPAKLATQIGLEISKGDLDKAAADLATFAKSGERVSKDVGKSQNDSLQTVLALGSATKSYLADLVAAGTPAAKIKDEAAKFRADYTKQLASVRIVGEAAKRYLDVLGVSDTAVETSIKVSGDEIATAKIKSYIELLKDKIPADVATRIAADLKDGNLAAAEKELDDFLAKLRTVDITVELKNKQQLVDIVKNIFGLGLFGTPQQPSTPAGAVPAAGGTRSAGGGGFGGSDLPRNQGTRPLLPPALSRAEAPTAAGLPAVPTSAKYGWQGYEQIGKNGVKYRFDATLGPDGEWVPHYKAGGTVSRWQDFIGGGHVPGSGNTDSVRAMLMPREYVATTAAVDRYGVSVYEAMNRLELDPGVLAAAVRGSATPDSWVEPKKYATGGLVDGGGAWAPSWSQPDAPAPSAPAMVAVEPARRSGLSDRPYEPHYHFEGRPDENTLASATARGIRDGEHLVGF